MFYLAWDREIKISLFFCDVFVWKRGPRPRTSSRCYHGNNSAATFIKGIFVHPPWASNSMQNLKGGWKFSFPKMFDSYKDLFLIRLFRPVSSQAPSKGFQHSTTARSRICKWGCSSDNCTWCWCTGNWWWRPVTLFCWGRGRGNLQSLGAARFGCRRFWLWLWLWVFINYKKCQFHTLSLYKLKLKALFQPWANAFVCFRFEPPLLLK